MEKQKTAVDIISEVIQTMCDKHCKYPKEYLDKYVNEEEAEEHLYSECCDKCVLNKLM